MSTPLPPALAAGLLALVPLGTLAGPEIAAVCNDAGEGIGHPGKVVRERN